MLHDTLSHPLTLTLISPPHPPLPPSLSCCLPRKGSAAMAALSEACWRPVTLTNPLEATLVFSVTTEGL